MPRWMPRLATCGLALLLLHGTIGVARADGDPAPYETVRAMEALQDRIAGGDMLAQATYARAVLRAGRAFTKMKPETWGDKRNARALVLYLFSGGDARAIDAAVPRNAVPDSLAGLLAGAIAYGTGDDEAARAALLPIDARSLPSALGGHLALVQATLLARDSDAKAIALLDLARLLEPGTLVEEAALRKEMSLIGATGDLDKFALLTRRYLGAFPRSTYADNFRQLVARTAMRLGAGDTAEEGAKLAKLMAGLDRVERRRLYLAIAREAVVAGHATMAALAGDAAGRLAQPGDTEAARAMTYYGAASIVGPQYDLGLKALATAPSDRLDANDRALRTSALAVAEMIRKPVDAGGTGDAPGNEAAILADGERALGDANGLLKAALP